MDHRMLFRWLTALVLAMAWLNVSPSVAQPDAAAPPIPPIPPIPSASGSGTITLAIGRLKPSASLQKSLEASGKAMSLARLADMMDSQLIDRFQNTRKFKIMARSDLDSVIEEQKLFATAQANGASHVLVLSIDDFQDVQETISAADLGQRAVRKVRLVPTVKIYRTLSNEALAVASMPLEIETANTTAANVQRDGSASDGILSAVAREAARLLAQRVVDVLFVPKVVSRSGQEVTINRGDALLMAVGQVWEVRGPDTTETDPDTGEKLSIPGPVLGSVTISQVRPSISIANVTDEADIGLIKKGASLFRGQSSAGQPLRIMLDKNLQPVESASPAPLSSGGQASRPVGAAASGTAPQVMTVGVYHFKVPPEVMSSIEKEGRVGNLRKVLSQLDARLTHRLVETGKYNLVTIADQNDLSQMKKSQQQGDFDPSQLPELFKGQGARYVVVTTLNEYLDKTEVTDLPTRKQKVINRTVRLSAIVKLIDVQTNQIVETAETVQELEPFDTIVDDMTQANTITGDEILTGLADRVSTDIAVKISSNLYPVLVIDRTDDQVVVNMGAPLIQVGQVWTVRGAAKQKRDPGTGKMLTIAGMELGQIQIIECDKNSAYAQVIKERTPGVIKEGAVLRQLVLPAKSANPAEQ